MRLFLALWPDDDVRERIAAVSAGLPNKCGRPVPRENLHLTLAFLGSVAGDAAGDLQRRMAAVQAEPFNLVFDRCGWFRRARVIWLAPSEAPAALADLAQQLREAARDCGITVDDRPFQAHLTLARKAAAPPGHLEFEPIRWHVDRFCLIRSETRPEGAVYRILERRALSSG